MVDVSVNSAGNCICARFRGVQTTTPIAHIMHVAVYKESKQIYDCINIYISDSLEPLTFTFVDPDKALAAYKMIQKAIADYYPVARTRLTNQGRQGNT